MSTKVYILLAITAILWGSMPILDKIAVSKISPLSAVTIRTLAACAVIVLFLAFTGQTKKIFSVDLRTIMILSVSGIVASLIAMVTYYAALKEGATSVVVPIAATYPLVTAALSVLILGEGVTLLRVAGTALIVAGIWLVKM